MDLSCYNSYYEIDLRKIAENYRKVCTHVAPTGVIPVLKANAYGIGLREAAKVLVQRCGSPVIACAQVYEGMALRECGLTDIDIILVGQVLKQALPHAVKWDLQLPLFSVQRAVSLSEEGARQGKTVKVHIKIETGMNRLGVKPGEELAELIRAVKSLPNLQVMGVHTHFAQAEIGGDEYTMLQFDRFRRGVEQLRAAGIDPPYVHCCNTGAAEWYREAVEYSTHVRVGSLVLGYSDLEDGTNPFGVQDPLSWHSRISTIRTVYPGETVGYNRRFRPEKPTRIALVGVGYADGLFCPMCRSHGPVLVKETRTHFIDACMDQCFIDVTDVDCRPGDEVTFFGYSSGGAYLSVQEFSQYGQLYPAYTASPPERVGRVYIE